MKRFFAVILVVVLVISVAACTATTTDEQAEDVGSDTTVEDANPEDVNVEDAVSDDVGTEDEDSDEVSGDDYDPSTKTLMCVLPIKGHPVFQIVRAGFINKCKELGYKVEVAGIDGVDEAQYIAQCEAAIAKGVDGIMIWPLGPYLYPTMEKLDAAGIVIVAPHVPTPEGEEHGLDANFSADPIAYGKEAAMAMGKELEGKTGSIAITQTAFNELENDAANSFKETIEANFPNLTVLDPEVEGGEVAAATQINTAIIQANSDLLGAFSTTGGGCQSWSGAKRATSNTGLVVIGMDYTEQNIDLIKNGEVFGFIAQPLYEEAEFSVEAMDTILRGGEIPYFTVLDAPLVTIDNIEYYEELLQEIKNWFG